MCFVLTIVLIVATVAFYGQGLMLQSVLSGLLAFIALFFLVRKLIKNGRCIFGNDRDCTPR